MFSLVSVIMTISEGNFLTRLQAIVGKESATGEPRLNNLSSKSLSTK